MTQDPNIPPAPTPPGQDVPIWDPPRDPTPDMPRDPVVPQPGDPAQPVPGDLPQRQGTAPRP